MTSPTSTHPTRRALRALGSLALLGALAACGSDTGSAQPPTSGGDSPSASSDAPAGGGPSCTYTESGQAAREAELPPEQAAQSGQVPVTIATDVGDIGATLDADAAPCTVNSFVSLADQGYFDDTPCHRLTTTRGLEVLQCGDPSGTGGGGPGYSFADELSGDETYPAGTLAMANAGPDTNGSQFFIVYGDSQLPPAYTVFGTVDDAGLGVVEDVAADGVDGGGQDGPPATPVTITGVSAG